MDLRRFGLLCAVLSVVLAGCSGAALGTGGRDADDPAVLHACSTQSAVSASEIPPEHRALAAACSPTPADANAPIYTYGAAGIPCTSDAQCGSDGGLPGHCLRGACAIDECLTDGDCSGGGACVCSVGSIGSDLVEKLNYCAHGNCRIDSDCGAGGYCVPSASLCVSPVGFFCHTAADTCVDPAIDCPSSCVSACSYFVDRGAFACMAPFAGGC
jgi:hypothetical protein